MKYTLTFSNFQYNIFPLCCLLTSQQSVELLWNLRRERGREGERERGREEREREERGGERERGGEKSSTTDTLYSFECFRFSH